MSQLTTTKPLPSFWFHRTYRKLLKMYLNNIPDHRPLSGLYVGGAKKRAFLLLLFYFTFFNFSFQVFFRKFFHFFLALKWWRDREGVLPVFLLVPHHVSRWLSPLLGGGGFNDVIISPGCFDFDCEFRKACILTVSPELKYVIHKYKSKLKFHIVTCFGNDIFPPTYH